MAALTVLQYKVSILSCCCSVLQCCICVWKVAATRAGCALFSPIICVQNEVLMLLTIDPELTSGTSCSFLRHEFSLYWFLTSV